MTRRGRLLRRFASAALLVLLVTSAAFLLLHLLPGDAFSQPEAPRGSESRLRTLWGLDRPLGERYLTWLGGIATRWDWGTSYRFRRPVATLLAEAVPHTLALGFAALLVEYGLGVGLGFWSGARPHSRASRVADRLAMGVYALPTFWLAVVTLYLARLVPGLSTGLLDPAHGSWVDRALALLVPALVLGTSATAAVLQFTRGRVESILRGSEVLALRARGIAESRILWRHVLRRTAVPLSQLLGLSLPALLSGSLVVEVIFSRPGLGRLGYQALLGRDYPLVLAVTAWSGALVVLGSILADLLLVAADPRTRGG